MASFEGINTLKELKERLKMSANTNKGLSAIHEKFKRDHMGMGHEGINPFQLSLMIANWRQNNVTISTLLIDGSFVKSAHDEILNWINKADETFFEKDGNGWRIRNRGTAVPSINRYNFITVTELELLKKALRKDEKAQWSAMRKYTTNSNNGVGVACCLDGDRIFIYHVDW